MRRDCSICRSLHDLGNFAVESAGDVVGSVMLDVVALAELAGPLAADSLSCRVNVGEAGAVEGDLEEAASDCNTPMSAPALHPAADAQ